MCTGRLKSCLTSRYLVIVSISLVSLFLLKHNNLSRSLFKSEFINHKSIKSSNQTLNTATTAYPTTTKTPSTSPSTSNPTLEPTAHPHIATVETMSPSTSNPTLEPTAHPHIATVEAYMNALLFADNTDLFEYFIESNQYVEFYDDLDNLRRSRVVQGDVSRLRLLLHKLKIAKKCINAMVIGGSVTVRGWPRHLQYWLNGYYPCNGTHIVDNKAHGAAGSDIHFWELTDKLNWKKNIGTPYDLIIMETSTNSRGQEQDVWNEMIMRHLLLLENEPTIIYLQATQAGNQYLDGKGTNIHGNFEQLINLNYYQIPCVSLSVMIYPKMYRYYLNHFNNTITAVDGATVDKSLHDNLPYLFDDDDSGSSADFIKFNNEHIDTYHDDRFSFESSGGHLRVDNIHPTEQGMKFLVLLIAYMFATEYDNMVWDVTHMHDNAGISSDVNMSNDINFDLYYKNKLWLHPTINSIPPILFRFESDWQQKLFIHLSNHHVKSNNIHFDHYMSNINTERYFKKYEMYDYVSENWNDNWEILCENEKQRKVGIMCNETNERCKLSMNISAVFEKGNEKYCTSKDNAGLMVVSIYVISHDVSMGTAVVWVDSLENITDEWQKQVYQRLDGHTPIVQTISEKDYFVVNCNNYELNEHLYYHLLIVDSIPERKLNKFILHSLYFVALSDLGCDCDQDKNIINDCPIC